MTPARPRGPAGVHREPARAEPIASAARMARLPEQAADRARRLAIMGDAAGTPEGVRRLMAHDPGHRHAHSVLEAVAR